MDRRAFISGAAALTAAGAAKAQSPSPHAHHGQYERLSQPGRIDYPDLARQHAVTESPAPKAAHPGRWVTKAPLPIPRTEMAWAAELNGRLHVIGGYAEQRVDRPYHHAYDPGADAWTELAPLPRGANHVGVASLGGRIYAFGGFLEQNRTPHDGVYVFEPGGAEGRGAWRTLRRLPEACGAMACVAHEGLIHLIGGAVGSEMRRSVDWHFAYDPNADRYARRPPMPGPPRDHAGVAVLDGRIHLVGGRVDSFHTNSALHHAYDARADAWTMRAPVPTPRSGHGSVELNGRLIVMGGEGTNRVFGQTESYDPARDAWEALAPMLTPRHGMGAVVLGDAIHVAGGGPQMGGGVKSAVHEAWVSG